MSTVDTTRQMEAFRHTDDAADLAIERLTTPARPHRSTIDVLGRGGGACGAPPTAPPGRRYGPWP